MAGICFFFEDPDKDVWSGKNLDAWNYACKVAGDMGSMIVINKTTQTITTPDADMSFHVVSTYEEAMELMSGEIQHLCCPWDSNVQNIISIAGYPHTADWYVFGGANGWSGYTIPNGLTVPQAGQAAVHSVHAATVVMFHRFWTLNYGS